MKKQIIKLLMVVGVIATFLGCSDSDPISLYTPSQSVLDAFRAKYPNAQHISWIERAGYDVVTFITTPPTSSQTKNNTSSLVRYEAWFTKSAEWARSSIELNKSMLPQAILDNIATSEYATWEIDDVILREQAPPLKNIYIIEIESDDMDDMLLIYTESGELLVATPDTDITDDIPAMIPQAIKDFITTKYGESAQIYDFDDDDDMYEAIVVANSVIYEVLFNLDMEWIESYNEIAYSDLPTEVLNGFMASDYSTWRVDDVYMFSNPNYETLYIIEAEADEPEDQEVTLYFDATGAIVDPNVPPTPAS